MLLSAVFLIAMESNMITIHNQPLYRQLGPGHYGRLCTVLFVAAMLLGACGRDSNDQGLHLSPVPALAPTTDPIAQLQTQLAADDVIVTAIQHDPGPPASVTITYQFNERGIATTTLDLSSAIYIETERVVEAVTRRVVALVAAGAPLDHVVLLRTGSAPEQRMRISVADMQAWSAGNLSSEAYRERRYGGAANAYPAPGGSGYPLPNGGRSESYPAP